MKKINQINQLNKIDKMQQPTKQVDTAIVLAGGLGSRLKRDKKAILVNEQHLIDYILDQLKPLFRQIIVVDNSQWCYSERFVKVQDIITGSALGGIYSGLSYAQSEYAYVLACDMPFVNVQYVDFLVQELGKSKTKPTAIITQYEDWAEPFNGLYARSLLKPMAEFLQAGRKSIYQFLQKTGGYQLIAEGKARGFSPDWRMFFNINTPRELEEFYILHQLANRQVD